MDIKVDEKLTTTSPYQFNERNSIPDLMLCYEDIQKPPFIISSAYMEKTLRQSNPRKAVGRDSIPGSMLWACLSELTDVYVNIFKAQASLPSWLKKYITVHLLKKSTVTQVNKYWLFALTPIVLKYFERLVMTHIHRNIPDALAQLIPINTAIRTAPSHHI